MMTWFTQHIWNIFLGFVTAISSYFLPVRNIVYVMFFAILIDLLFGVLAARKRGEGIKPEKLWDTAKKLLISVILISLLYSIDKEIGGDMIQLHKIMAWFIAGFEVWSIIKSFTELSSSTLFRLLKHLMEDKVEEKTGIKLGINEKKDNESRA